MKTTQILILTGVLLMPFALKASITGSCAPLDEDGNEVDSCTWTLDGDTLTISGNGPMKDYGIVRQNGLDTTDAPWNDRNPDQNTGSLYQIRHVVVEDGITNIGDHFMSAAQGVTDIKIGDGVTNIGTSAFYACNAQNVILGKNVETIESSAFHSNLISNFVLPDKIKTIEDAALWGVSDDELVLPSSLTSAPTGLPVHHPLRVYCQKGNESICEEIMAYTNNSWLSKYAQNLSIGIYEKKGNRYIFDGVAYRSLEDYYNHEPVKRIYTIKEANEAAGKKNKVMIRYK